MYTDLIEVTANLTPGIEANIQYNSNYNGVTTTYVFGLTKLQLESAVSFAQAFVQNEYVSVEDYTTFINMIANTPADATNIIADAVNGDQILRSLTAIQESMVEWDAAYKMDAFQPLYVFKVVHDSLTKV